MKTGRRQRTKPTLKRAKAKRLKFQRVSVPAFQLLTARLAEVEETLRAIRTGEVDAVVITRNRSARVFTLDSAERAYRVLIESMNEGALMLTADKTILYSNRSFARMVKYPLEQVMGGSFSRFLGVVDRTTLQPLLKRSARSGAKLPVQLIARDGAKMPVQISIRPLARNGVKHGPIGMVVTDLSAARRTEELLRSLTHRVVRTQETERGRVARELHDHITQLLCAILFRSQALVNELADRAGPSLGEAVKLREMLGQTAREVERISRNLRPGVLEQLGLAAVLRATGTEFADRTSVPVTLTCVQLTAPLPGDAELALYRILQEALKNVERHAGARNVTVRLTQPGGFAQLTIDDDGIGFDSARRKGKGGLGLLGMCERATAVGGALTIKSDGRAGTKIEVRIPLAPGPAMAA